MSSNILSMLISIWCTDESMACRSSCGTGYSPEYRGCSGSENVFWTTSVRACSRQSARTAVIARRWFSFSSSRSLIFPEFIDRTNTHKYMLFSSRTAWKPQFPISQLNEMNEKSFLLRSAFCIWACVDQRDVNCSVVYSTLATHRYNTFHWSACMCYVWHMCVWCETPSYMDLWMYIYGHIFHVCAVFARMWCMSWYICR